MFDGYESRPIENHVEHHITFNLKCKDLLFVFLPLLIIIICAL